MGLGGGISPKSKKANPVSQSLPKMSLVGKIENDQVQSSTGEMELVVSYTF